MMFGTDEQKWRFLPATRKAAEFWCKGFSEPDAGSDLANVKTTAVRDGDEWVINRQKLWTRLCQIADWIFVVPNGFDRLTPSILAASSNRYRAARARS